MKLEDLLVDEYVSPIQYFATPETPITDLKEKMKEFGFRHIPVMDNERAVGIISDRDLKLSGLMADQKGLKASDIMVKEPFSVTLGTPLDRVAFSLSDQKIGSALVINPAGNVEGIFTSTDALNALVEIVRDSYK